MPNVDFRSVRPLATRFSLVVPLLALTGVVAPARGQPAVPAVVSADIPGGPLREALRRFAQASSVAIGLDAGVDVDGLESPGVQGTVAVPEGLRALLAGTGLVAVESNGRYRIQWGSGPRPATLAPVLVVGEAQAETATGPVAGYKASRSSTATRIDVALQDQPVSVVVIPAEVIADQGVRNTTEVADYVAGVARETTEYSP